MDFLFLLLKLAFLFCTGSLLGWCLEVVYRRWAHKKWINPGFLTGPCLPLYGFSLVALYLLAQIDLSFITNPKIEKLVLFIVMSICITFVEYIAGLIFIKGMKIKLWDYSKMWGNIQGIICPLFSFFWMLLSAFYYFFIHPRILDGLDWFVRHIAFSFVIGFYYGVLAVDIVYSFKVADRIRKFAKEKEVVIRLENFKASIEKNNFILQFHNEIDSMRNDLDSYYEKAKAKIAQEKLEFEQREAAKRAKIEKKIADKRAKKENKK
ncbi:MAG: putative ABC transporter permease [Treponemataceae bacterium]|nr:putative ABC transporter permease [Treponemataceae bacterium]